MGKIPLTNSELIKALLLRSGNFASNTELVRIRQLEISSEWDRIEYALQNEDMWFFLTNKEINLVSDSRIDYIFQLMAKDKSLIYNKENVEDDLLPFHVFNNWFSESNDPSTALEQIWKEIKDYYLTFEEWYQDRNLYHLIGFLITCGIPITQLKKDNQQKTKNEFEKYLKEQICKLVNYRNHTSRKSYKLEDLDYSNTHDKSFIRKILLLYNIITLNMNKNSNSKFPFKSYKQEQWDLEHIHALRSQISEREHEKLEWIKNAYMELPHEEDELIAECKILISTQNSIEYDDYIEIMLNKFAEHGEHEDINNISNIALLDAETNRSYGNAIFCLKRKIIIEKDKKGIFIPQCTKNVFLKYYSLTLDQNSLWNKLDREAYVQNIISVLNEFLPKEESES